LLFIVSEHGLLNPVIPYIWRIVKLDTQQLGQRIDVPFVAMLQVVFIKLFSRGQTLLQTHTLNLCCRNIFALPCINPNFGGVLFKELMMWRYLQVYNLGRSSRKRRMFARSYRMYTLGTL
jgi:hypothetical protein